MGVATPFNRVDVDGFPIDIDGEEDILHHMDEAIQNKTFGHYICITNTESIYHGRRVKSHASFIRGADFSLCDGVGVVAVARARGHRISRFNGPILQLRCSEFGASRGWRHFYLGGSDGSALEMERRLKQKYPGMIVCGAYEPPFRPLLAQEREELVRKIHDARPDIVWVGLGLIKQEAMIASLIEEAQVPWMIGVGGAFDYHSGRLPWAPAALRRIGVEWIFRLVMQPKARAKRYWWSGKWVAAGSLRSLRARFGHRSSKRFPPER